MKQETLEEAAERLSEKHHYAFGQQSEFYQLGFIEAFDKVRLVIRCT